MLILILYKTRTNFFDETYQNKTKNLISPTLCKDRTPVGPVGTHL